MKPIEWKTKAQSIATFIVATAGLSWLTNESTDLVHAFPDWAEAPAYAAVLALSGLLAGYVAKHKATAMSDSAVTALMRRGVLPGDNRTSTIRDLSR